MSISYEIYKGAVGGKTMTGEDMKQFNEMGDLQKNGWKAVDEHFKKKVEIPTESATYELYKSKNKDAKDYIDLPDNIKKIWSNLDRNYDKIVKIPVPKPNKDNKPKKEVEPEIIKLTKKANELKTVDKKKKNLSISKKLEELKKGN